MLQTKRLLCVFHVQKNLTIHLKGIEDVAVRTELKLKVLQLYASLDMLASTRRRWCARNGVRFDKRKWDQLRVLETQDEADRAIEDIRSTLTNLGLLELLNTFDVHYFNRRELWVYAYTRQYSCCE